MPEIFDSFNIPLEFHRLNQHCFTLIALFNPTSQIKKIRVISFNMSAIFLRDTFFYGRFCLKRKIDHLLNDVLSDGPFMVRVKVVFSQKNCLKVEIVASCISVSSLFVRFIHWINVKWTLNIFQIEIGQMIHGWNFYGHPISHTM